jgi:hypothetical protein
VQFIRGAKTEAPWLELRGAAASAARARNPMPSKRTVFGTTKTKYEGRETDLLKRSSSYLRKKLDWRSAGTKLYHDS